MRLFAVVSFALLSGCSSTQPAVTTPPEAPPVAEPVATPEPEAPGPTRPAKGIVSEDRLDQLIERDRVPPASPSSLTVYATCSDDPAGEQCKVPHGIVGVSGDKVAVRIADDEGGCADGDPSDGWIASTTSVKPTKKVKLALDSGGDDDKVPGANWKWIAGLAKAGYTPAPHLLAATTDEQSGIRGHAPVAILAAPLEGWFLDASSIDAQGSATVALVSPDNQTRHVLGQLPARKNTYCKGAERKAGECRDHTDVTLVDAVLSADRGHLFVLGTQMDGSHCGPSPSFLSVYPIPAGVTLTP